MSQGEKDCEECLTSTISAKLHEGAQKAESLFSSACICRVPEKLRKLNASAYTPQLIAIGPLHQNDKYHQTPMQQVKMSYANHLLCRLTKGVEDRELARFSLLQECVAEMKLSIDYAKKCYAEEVTLDVEMILVDGCFILELLYRNFEFYWFFCNIDSSHPVVGSDNGYSEETTTTSTELLSVPESRIEVSVPESRIEVERSQTIEEILFDKYCAVENDLLLLENQIPLLVLEKLFPLTMGRILSGPNRLSLTGYLVLYFGEKMRPEGNSTDDHVLRVFGNKMENSEPEEGEVVPSRPAANHYHHILHKVHDGSLPPDHQTGKNKLDILPSVLFTCYFA